MTSFFDDAKDRIETTRLDAIRRYFEAEAKGRTPEEREFLAWCDYLVGDTDEVPRTDFIFYGLAPLRKFLPDGFVPDGEWTAYDGRLVDCLVVNDTVHDWATGMLCVQAQERGVIDPLTERLNSLGVSPQDIERALFDSAAFVADGEPTPFGRKVLDMPADHALELAAETQEAAKLVELYLTCVPERFTAHAEAIIDIVTSAFGFTYVMREIAALAPGEHVERMKELVGRVDAAAEERHLARFLAVYYFEQSFPEEDDFMFDFVSSFAVDVLTADRDETLIASWPYANGHNYLKSRLVEWLLVNFGARAKKLVGRYKNDNYVIRIRDYYPLLVEHLGQDAVPILVRGTATKRLASGVYGFMEHEVYYQRMLQMLVPFDTSKYDEKIRSKLLGHDNENVRKMAERVFEHDPSERRAVDWTESWGLRGFAEATIEEFADAIASTDTQAPDVIDVGVSFEEEPCIPFVTMRTDGEWHDVRCDIDLAFDYGELRRFLDKHGLVESDQIRFGDTEKPPLSILMYELTQALRSLPELLDERDFTLADGFTLKLDEFDIEKAAPHREASVRRGVNYAFLDNHGAREFAILCYEDPERRAWLESLARPLLRYELTQ